MPAIITKSAKETQKVAALLASSVKTPTIIALEGNLGSGKTTFVQGFARALGIKENILSPTFVLLKAYPLKRGKRFKHLAHIDCYRLGSPQELLHLGFRDIIKDKDAVILIEWADKIKKLLPKNILWIRFFHGKKPQERVIYIYEKSSSN